MRSLCIMNPLLAYEFVAVSVLLAYFLWRSRSWPVQKAARVEYIDVIKGLAMVLVISVHVADLYPSARWLNIWTLAGLPLFVFASGYVLGLRYLEKFNAKRYAERTLVRIVLPYLVWSCIMLWLSGTRVVDVPAALLFGRANSNYYFIPLLLTLYCLFPLIRRYRQVFLSIPAVIVAYGLTMTASLWHAHLEAALWNANEWSLLFFGRFFVFFLLGIKLSRYDLVKAPKRNIALLGLAGVFATMAASYFARGAYPLTIFSIAVAMLVLLAYRVWPAPWKLFAVLGPYTLVMYFVHTRFVYTWGGPQVGWFIHGAYGYVTVIVFVTAVAYGIARLVDMLVTRVVKLYSP